MAEAPTPEELEAKRKELEDLQRATEEYVREKDEEAAAARRQAEYEKLEQEIAFAKQAAGLLVNPPSSEESSVENTPPNNSTVEPETEPEENEPEAPSEPELPKFSFNSADEKDGE